MASSSLRLFILVAIGISHALAKTCTKELRFTYMTWKMDSFTQQLRPMPQAVKRISLVCCPGYQRVGQRGTTPLCEPVCKLNCINGYCDSTYRCVCYEGFKQLENERCVPEEDEQTTTTTTTTMRPTTTTTMPTTTTTTTMRPTMTLTTTMRATMTTTMPTTTPRTTTTTMRPTTTTTTMRPTMKPTTTMRATTTTTMPTATTTTTMRPTTTPSTKTTRGITETKGISSEEIPLTRRMSRMQEQPPVNAVPPGQFLEHKPMSIEPRIGSPQEAGSIKDLECKGRLNCACPVGYTLDSQSFKCRPLCNGKIYGCIGGTCIGVNQCRCDEGTYLAGGELFHCQAGHSYWKWLLLLLLIPAGLIVVSICVAMRRWRTAKAHRLAAQGESFVEVRLNRSGDHDDDEVSFGECSSSPGVHLQSLKRKC